MKQTEGVKFEVCGLSTRSKKEIRKRNKAIVFVCDVSGHIEASLDVHVLPSLSVCGCSVSVASHVWTHVLSFSPCFSKMLRVAELLVFFATF